MKAKNLENIKEFEPFTTMLNSGFGPEKIKKLIVKTLHPYVFDKKFLSEKATTLLSVEAVRVGKIISRDDWKNLFEISFSIRNFAIEKNQEKVLSVISTFQKSIDDSKRFFDLVVSFEERKSKMEMDEFAFEIFRNLGLLIESVIQPYLREFYCFCAIAKDLIFDEKKVLEESLGSIVDKIENILPEISMCKILPGDIKISQWRNIAQHQSYLVEEFSICVMYGKTGSLKKLNFSRDEIASISREIVCRLSIFKSSRELMILNHYKIIYPILSRSAISISDAALMIASAIAIQGFRLVKLKEENDCVVAQILDVDTTKKQKRHIHCSQLLLFVALYFENKNIEIQYNVENGSGKWFFYISKIDLKNIYELPDMYVGLAEKFKYRYEI